MPRKKDRWPDLCSLVLEDDGLPVREAGSWTEDKLFYWNRYLEITTTAMVGSPFWPAVVYVDLFAGPGILRLRDSGKRIPGSVLLAANTPKPFDLILACEKDPATAETCLARLASSGAGQRSEVFVGDCNRQIDNLVKRIPERALTLAFVDPEGLHAKFETLRKLADGRRVNLLILLADRMDAVRNIKLYHSQSSSNLDDFLGPDCDWRAAYNELPKHEDGTAVGLMLERLLRKQLQEVLGYTVFSGEVMRTSKSAIYRVIYASKSDKGLDFWNKVSKIDYQGQQRWF